MKVLWFTYIMMPKFADKYRLPAINFAGWMPALSAALRERNSEIELTVVQIGVGGNRTCKVDGVKYISFQPPRILRRFNGLVMRWYRQRIVQMLKVENPDVIHIHGSETVAMLLPPEVYEFAPTLISLQGISNGLYSHYMGGLSYEELDPFTHLWNRFLLKNDIRARNRWWREVKAPAERRVLERVKYVAGRTSWDRAWAYALNSSAKYSFVGEALRDPFYKIRRNVENIKGHSIYCSAATTYPLKGGHWLIKALAIVKRKYPDVLLHIAGGYNVIDRSWKRRILADPYHAYLRNLIDENKLWGNIVFHKSLSADAVARLLAEVEVFCLPSLIENSSNSLGEAMIVGTPVVATCVGGGPDIVKDGVTGRLVQSGDPAVLAAAIMSVFEAPEKELENQISAAREVALKVFSREGTVDQLLTVYHEMAGTLK